MHKNSQTIFLLQQLSIKVIKLNIFWKSKIKKKIHKYFIGKIIKKENTPRILEYQTVKSSKKIKEKNWGKKALKEWTQNFSEINQSIKNFMKFPQSNTKKYKFKYQHNMRVWTSKKSTDRRTKLATYQNDYDDHIWNILCILSKTKTTVSNIEIV